MKETPACSLFGIRHRTWHDRKKCNVNAFQVCPPLIIARLTTLTVENPSLYWCLNCTYCTHKAAYRALFLCIMHSFTILPYLSLQHSCHLSLNHCPLMIMEWLLRMRSHVQDALRPRPHTPGGPQWPHKFSGETMTHAAIGACMGAGP